MTLLQMSFSGAVLILVITVIRTLPINRLPKITFPILWYTAILRLLLPVSITSSLSIYSLLGRSTAVQDILTETPAAAVIPITSVTRLPLELTATLAAPDTSLNIWPMIWLVGTLICLTFVSITYLRCRFELQTSLPVNDPFLSAWLQNHKLRRPIAIRQSDKFSTPLTYGIFRPVIILPKNTDWQNEQQLQYILEHEYIHIRRFDAAGKLLAVLALCVHWFDPLVWLMYVLFNRDIELACDEGVVHRFGPDTRSAYAHTLIGMEEQKSGLTPLYNSFSHNAIKARITAIMKTGKLTLGAVTAAILLITAATICLTTSGATPRNEQLVYAFERLYIATGQDVTDQVNAAGTPAVVGKIAVSVPADWRPTGSFQANFEATGAEVIKYDTGIAVNIDGKWLEFAKATYRISYQDEISQITADIPYTWTYELINSADNYEADVLVGDDTSASPDVGLRIFVEGKKDNVIEILRRTEPDDNLEVQGFRYLDDVSITSTTRDTLSRNITTRITPDNYVIHSDLDKDVRGANLDDLYSFRVSVAIIDNDLPYAGFIRDISADSITLDPVEFITRDDTDRMAELGLTEQDMIPGYYIHNPDPTTITWQLADNTIYTFIDWHNDYTQPGESREVRTNQNAIFREYLRGYDQEPGMPFFFTVQNDTVTDILEKWLA